MKAAYLITIATATLWSCVLCAPTTVKAPSPGAAHRHMPKIVAAYEELRKKFENLKAVMSEIKALGYTGGGLPAFSMTKNKTETTKSGAPDFSDFIHMPGEPTGTEAPGKSIDDAPVERKMTPSERMKLLSQKFHAAHRGRGSMLSPGLGATGTIPPLAASSMKNLKSALSQFKHDIKETILSETPVENPNIKKDKVDIAEQMRAKLDVQNRLQKFREEIKRQRVHRVGEIRPPVILNRKGYNRIKRSAPRNPR